MAWSDAARRAAAEVRRRNKRLKPIRYKRIFEDSPHGAKKALFSLTDKKTRKEFSGAQYHAQDARGHWTVFSKKGRRAKVSLRGHASGWSYNEVKIGRKV